MTMANTDERGSLIVFEGCDRPGNTTQVGKLVESLIKEGKPTKMIRFPDSTMDIGSVINSYLTDNKEVDDRAIHLLFSANRWEMVKVILDTLQEGTSVIIDQYAYGGVAFSAAKEGLTLEWCKQPDIGLPKPDLVCYMDVTEGVVKDREDPGEERYELSQFQRKVKENYMNLYDPSWVTVPTEGTLIEVEEELHHIVGKEVNKVKKGELRKLWV